MKPCFFSILLFISGITLAQNNVGIGTTTPNAKAILEVKSTDKGILFPRMTSEQRNAILNPPNGLHIFNTTERCLNYYDSMFQVWNCYCDGDTCHQVTIKLPPGCSIDFKTTYASKYTGVTKFFLLLEAGDTLYGCGTGALNFSTMTTFATVKIINRGVIMGNGGSGGSGATGNTGSCIRNAGAGAQGGHAILTSLAVSVTVDNYGFIAAGGGGGGGGGSTGADIYGGGGGGGAGIQNVTGGNGGGTTFSGPFGSCGTINKIAQDGTAGTNSTAGIGGAGANGGGNGGNGAALGLQGQSGTGTNPGAGGLPGKAISGGSGNVINNLQNGQTIGAVD